MTTVDIAQLKTELAQFYGTTQYHRWSGLTNLVCTDGVHHLAEQASAYWLLDAIASHQTSRAIQSCERLKDFQVWLLHVEAVEGNGGRLECLEDSDQPPSIVQDIEFTDFPLSEIKFYVCNGVLMLPSEY